MITRMKRTRKKTRTRREHGVVTRISMEMPTTGMTGLEIKDLDRRIAIGDQ